MADNPGVGAECLLELFAPPAADGVEVNARAHYGAILLLEAVLAIKAIAKGLSR